MNNLLDKLGIDYLLVNSTNKYLAEYSDLSENARYTLTGFTGSTGDALITRDKIYLFVDGRYHIQADLEAKEGVTVVKLRVGQFQDEEIKKIIDKNKVLGIVSKKVSQSRLELYDGYKIKLIEDDPINDHTEPHNNNYVKAFEPVKFTSEPAFITNQEEVSYITGLRDFSRDYSSKIWAKLFIDGDKRVLFNNDEDCDKFLSEFDSELLVDKYSINAHDYSLIKKPVFETSKVMLMKSVKTGEELEAYKFAFERTDKAMMAIREYIEQNDNLSEYDISVRLREEYIKHGAKNLSFSPIVAINQNSAQAHYSKSSKEVFLKDGDLVLIDSGAYYESGLATDITRVFVKGKPSELQKKVYTLVLKAFLNCFGSFNNVDITGFEIDSYAHKMLDNKIDGFTFNHGLGHGIGINVHEIPPNLSQSEVAKYNITDGMCFTIEPGLYNPKHFGIRLENSCYRIDGKTHSFVKMGYETKLIDFSMLTIQESILLESFKIL